MNIFEKSKYYIQLKVALKIQNIDVNVNKSMLPIC